MAAQVKASGCIECIYFASSFGLDPGQIGGNLKHFSGN